MTAGSGIFLPRSRSGRSQDRRPPLPRTVADTYHRSFSCPGGPNTNTNTNTPTSLSGPPVHSPFGPRFSCPQLYEFNVGKLVAPSGRPLTPPARVTASDCPSHWLFIDPKFFPCSKQPCLVCCTAATNSSECPTTKIICFLHKSNARADCFFMVIPLQDFGGQ